jgi:hypothetical protein
MVECGDVNLINSMQNSVCCWAVVIAVMHSSGLWDAVKLYSLELVIFGSFRDVSDINILGS